MKIKTDTCYTENEFRNLLLFCLEKHLQTLGGRSEAYEATLDLMKALLPAGVMEIEPYGK